MKQHLCIPSATLSLLCLAWEQRLHGARVGGHGHGAHFAQWLRRLLLPGLLLQEFVEDMRQHWINVKLYNPVGDPFRITGEKVSLSAPAHVASKGLLLSPTAAIHRSMETVM